MSENSLDTLLQTMIEWNASDLHLNHNMKIAYRVDGKIVQTEVYIEGRTIFDMLMAAGAVTTEQQTRFHDTKAISFSYVYQKSRFRGSLVWVRGQYSSVLRRINDTIIPLDQIGLPDGVKKILNSTWGLVLVTGPTGSGKTTTLASVVDHINTTKEYHIATIEEPIEVVHRPKKSIVTQREVGRDTPNFPEAMRDVLRRDPDVILIGEMRDLETVSTAVTAAETGHLVFGTLHTNTAPSSISRIVDIFPAIQQDNIRSQLAGNLRMIINQRLFSKIGGGRLPVYEIMMVTDEMRRMIRKNELELLEDEMRKSRNYGNIMMSDSINMAKQKGLIDKNIYW